MKIKTNFFFFLLALSLTSQVLAWGVSSSPIPRRLWDTPKAKTPPALANVRNSLIRNSLTSKAGAVLPRAPQSPWSVGLSYASRANLTEAEDGRTYLHGIDLEIGFQQTERLTWAAQVGGQYYSLGNDVIKEEGNPAANDSTFSGAYSLLKGSSFGLADSVAITLPTSYDTQFEGIRGVLGNMLSFQHQFYLLSFSHQLSLSYIQHTFDYSPTSNKINSAWTGGYLLNVNLPYKLNRFFTLGVDQIVSNQTNMSNEFLFKATTSLFASFSVQKVKFSLGYLVGSYDENESLRFSYRNEWQQKVKFGISYEL